MSLRNDHENLKNHINTLRGFVILLFITLGGAWLTIQDLSRTQTVSIPPDTRSGAIVELGKSHPANVFSFTAYIFHTLNDWVVDGSVEYSQNIYKLQHFFTKKYMQELLDDVLAKGSGGALSERARTLKLMGIYSDDNVDIVSDESWIVWLDFELTEHVKGLQIKKVNIRYPIKIVATDSNPDTNPWGLLLDGYSQSPFEIKDLEK